MIYFHSSISVDQQLVKSKSGNLNDPCLKMKQINQFHKNKRTSANHLSIPACEQSRSAIIDVIILIAVIGASGFLLYPYFKALVHNTVELGGEVVDVMREEIVRAPMVFGCLGLSISLAAIALMAITVCTDRKCGKPGCRGLKKAAEFDIQLETEECVKNSTCGAKNGLKKDCFNYLAITIGNWKLSSRRWRRLMEERFWFSEEDVDVLWAEWRFQDQERLERLRNSVVNILYFLQEHIRN